MKQVPFEKIAIIGCGVMGGIFARAWVNKHCVLPENLTLIDSFSEKQDDLANELGVPEHRRGFASLSASSLVVLAVKPQSFPELARELKPLLSWSTTIFSIMAGVSTETISELLPGHTVIRVMPNTPCSLGKGVLGWFTNDTDQNTEAIERLLSPLGVAIPASQEADLHTITAVSGSGPAWMFFVLQALTNFATKQGFSDYQARQLAINTMLGAAKLAETLSTPFDLLIQQVASKGGTTEAGLKSLTEHDVAGGLEKAMEAAARRSRELAGE